MGASVHTTVFGWRGRWPETNDRREGFSHGGLSGLRTASQDTPKGYYNLERMVRLVTNHGGEVGTCGSCMDARGLDETALTEGVHRSTLDELASWACWADKVIVF